MESSIFFNSLTPRSSSKATCLFLFAMMQLALGQTSVSLPSTTLKPPSLFKTHCDEGICTIQFPGTNKTAHDMIAYTEQMFEDFTNSSEMGNSALKKFLTKIGVLKEVDPNKPDLHAGHNHDYSLYFDDEFDPDYIDPNVAINTLCLTSEENAMKEYTGESTAQLSVYDFWLLLPRFTFDLASEYCSKDEEHPEHGGNNEKEERAKVWGIALTSVAVISLLSIIGILIVPLMKHSIYFNRLLSFLVALAVGTLVGDGLLHLLPHAMAGGHEGHDHSDENVVQEEQQKVLKSLVAVAGIYVFFVFETVMGLQRKSKRKKKALKNVLGSPSDLTAATPIKSSESFLPRSQDSKAMIFPPEEKVPFTQDADAQESGSSGCSSASVCDHKKCEAEGIQNCNRKPGNGVLDVKDVDVEEFSVHHNHGHGHNHDHDLANSGVKDMAWMIIMGDGLHNFSDGLAIGAAFSSSIAAGMSTSLAVFCHELPHELGDFAVLINAGMSIKQAILYNGLCACLAFFGVIIGMAIGEYTTSVKLWILAITAGGFLYVALVDMIPQMLESTLQKDGLVRFTYQNVGFILGVSIMLLIAMYETSFQAIFGLSGHAHH